MLIRLENNEMDIRIADCLLGTKVKYCDFNGELVGTCLSGFIVNFYDNEIFRSEVCIRETIELDSTEVEFSVYMGIQNSIKMRTLAHSDVMAFMISSEWTIGQCLTALDQFPPVIDWNYYFNNGSDV
jgi:hypothetical protein